MQFLSHNINTSVLARLAISACVLLAPLSFAHAQTTLNTILVMIFGVLELLPPLLVVVAVVVFFWGLIVFIWQADDDKGRERGRQVMIWGVIALFIVIALWGIIALLISIFGLDAAATCPPPQIGADTVTTC